MTTRPCLHSGGYSPTSHRESPGSTAGKSVWDSWRIRWHKDRFPPSTSVCPVNLIPPILHTHLHLQPSLTRRTNGENLGTFKKAMLFGNPGAFNIKVLPVSLNDNRAASYSLSKAYKGLQMKTPQHPQWTLTITYYVVGCIKLIQLTYFPNWRNC
jgi:hypothetical protein